MDSDTEVIKAGVTQTATSETPQIAVLSKEVSKIAKQHNATRHEPAKDCGKCHAGMADWSRNQLVQPLPDLCYSCHAKFETLSGYPHGPVVVGDCVFCHDAHQSRYVNLQKAPQPELCYLCHLPEDMSDIIEHQEKEKIICTDCHNPHTGSMMMRLKSPEETKGDPNTIESSI